MPLRIDPFTGALQNIPNAVRMSDIEPLSDPELEQAMGDMSRERTGGLQWLGEMLDKPGRAARGLLAGRPYELANLIPFSDTMGITDPRQSVSGRDMLESWGALGANQDGLDWGDVAGFGVEVITDPTNWFSLGGASAAKNALKGGAALTRQGMIDAVQAGSKKLVNFHTPDIFGLLPVKDLGGVGSGDAAAWALDKYYYSGASPYARLRQAFSSTPGVVGSAPSQHRILDLAADNSRIAADTAMKYGKEIGKMGAYAEQKFDDAATKILGDYQDVGAAQALKNHLDANPDSPVFDILKKHGITDPLQAPDMMGEVYGDIERSRKFNFEYMKNLDDEAQKLAEQVAKSRAINNATIGEDIWTKHWYDDTLRTLVESQSQLTKDEVARVMTKAGFGAGFDDLHDAVFSVAAKQQEYFKNILPELESLGVNVTELKDPTTGYAPRYINAAAPGVTRYMRKKLIDSPHADFMLGRNDILRGLGNTKVINDMTRDPLITGTKNVTKKAAEYIRQKYGLGYLNHFRGLQDPIGDIARASSDTAGFTKLATDQLIKTTPWAKQVADDGGDVLGEYLAKTGLAKPLKTDAEVEVLAEYLAKLPKDIVKEGMFSRGMINDTQKYMQQAARVKSGVVTLRKLLKDHGDISPITAPKNAWSLADEVMDGRVSLFDTWRNAGLTDTGLATFVAEHMGKTPDELKQILADPAQIADLVAKSKTLGVSKEVSRLTKRFMDFHADPGVKSAFEEVLDGLNAAWKGGQTLGVIVPRMAFHTRNRLGGALANFLHGVFTRKSEKAAEAIYFRKAANFGGKTNDEWLQMALDHELFGVGGGGVSMDTATSLDSAVSTVQMGRSPLAAKVRAFVMNPFGDVINDIGDTYKQGGLKGVAKGLAFGVELPDGRKSLNLNPFEFAGGYNPLTGQRVTETSNMAGHAGQQINNYVEFKNRMAPFMAMVEAGIDPAEAARRVEKIQFNYQKMSHWEKRWAKKIIPFYGFMRKNAEAQLGMLLENPGGRSAQMIRGINDARESDESYVPKYLAESFATKLPGFLQGPDPKSSRFLSLSGLTPVEETFNRVVMNANGTPDIHRTFEKAVGNLSAPLQAAFELQSGRQAWSGRRLSDLYEEPTGNPNANYWFSKTPYAAAYQMFTGNPLVDERKSWWQTAANYALGGAKITDIDPVKQRLLEIRDITEAKLGADPDIGTYTGVYAQDLKKLVERAQRGDGDALKKLQVYYATRQELRKMKKQSQHSKD